MIKVNQRKCGAILFYVNVIASILVGVTYTPLMIRLLGQSEYGLYSLIGSFIGYLSIFDMGLSNTIIRFVSINRINGNKKREAELNTVFLLIYSFLGCLVFLLGIIIYSHLEDIFGNSLTVDELQKAKVMVLLLIGNIAISLPLNLFSAIMMVYERFVFLRCINILRVIFNPLLALPLLYAGYGAVMIVMVFTFSNLLGLLVNMWYCFKSLQMKFSIGHYSFQFLWEITTYSFWVFLNEIMDKIYYSSGQFILGIVAGTKEVAVYAVAVQITMMYIQFSSAIGSVFFPKIVRVVSQGISAVEELGIITKIGRLQFIVVSYVFLMFLILGQEFLMLWAGEIYKSAYLSTAFLMLGLFIPLIQTAGSAIVLAKNLNKYRMTVYIVCAMMSLIASVPLAKHFGGIGCAVSTMLSLFISAGIFMNLFYRTKLGINIKKFWGNILQLGSSIVIFAICALGIHNYVPWNLNWISFFMEGSLYTLLYGGIIYKLSLNSYEKELCWEGLSRLKVIVFNR